MKKIMFAGCVAFLLAACGGGAGKTAQADAKAGAGATAKGTDGAVAAGSIDTAKLRADMDALLDTELSGKMDTAAWERVAADLGITPQQLLAEKGLDSMYANSKDPSLRAAAEQLKKLRDQTGWTPDLMDSLKQAADALKAR